MVRFSAITGLLWAAGLALASPPRLLPHHNVDVRTRNLPGASDEDTLHALWRRLAALAHGRRATVFKNSTSLDKSWNDATLFSRTFGLNSSDPNKPDNLEAHLSVDVTCVTCYFKAGASAELVVNGDFDFSDTVKNISSQLAVEFKNLTKTAIDSVGSVAKNFFNEIGDIFDDDEFDIEDLIRFDNFTVDTDIDINIPPLPEVQLLFQIDHLDLYMVIDTTIAAGATLTIPLYKSQSVVGVSVGEDLEMGLFVTMDLILSVEGEISLRTGFHLLLDDPVGFNIAMFSNNVSSIIFNGGKFEFLPVTIISGNVALKAILRIGMHAGFEMSSVVIPGLPSKIQEKAKFKAGVEVGVFATVAEFLTNITGGANLIAEDGCALKIVEEYTLAIGAVVGATLAVGEHTWNPTPNTTVPIFYTTLADVCAITTDARPVPTLARRQGQGQGPPDPNLDTQTITTKALYTAIECASPGLPSCPATLQRTSILTTTKTLVTAVPKGEQATFPPSTALTVPSTIPFGKQVNALSATTGLPVSYVPPPPPPASTSSTTAGGGGGGGKGGGGDILDDIGEVFNGQTGGVSNKLIIGLSVGLGVPFVAAVIAGLVYWLKRKRYAPVPKSDTAVEYTGEYQSPMASEREGMLKKTPVVSVGEVEK